MKYILLHFSIDGLEAVAEINKSYRKKLRHRKLVVNNLNRSFSQHQENYELFQELDLDIYTIPQDRNLVDSQRYHQSVWEYNPKSRSIPELEKLTAAILEA